uniref:DNA-directed RNA polymerase n=1 Tax=Physcomitrium patens TaxID=3218 RepID=A0A2K1IY94_PHYPA|nr:hypothetical protein PHYPA_024061 [Physcomitrium patens]
MLKLIHQIDDKIHAGGQRVGGMEVWTLEGFSVAYILQEILTIKSDHIHAPYEVLGAIVTGKPMPKPKTAPESFFHYLFLNCDLYL